MTISVGHGPIVDPAAFDGQGDDFRLPGHRESVICEMHVGSFQVPKDGAPGSFADAEAPFPHLCDLGVNAIQRMPVLNLPVNLPGAAILQLCSRRKAPTLGPMR